jgi:hypothetical protein
MLGATRHQQARVKSMHWMANSAYLYLDVLFHPISLDGTSRILIGPTPIHALRPTITANNQGYERPSKSLAKSWVGGWESPLRPSDRTGAKRPSRPRGREGQEAGAQSCGFQIRA